ncbi:uncharacterized protein LOC18429550 isoform X2 [Amborella trichopoda]|uniref:uncharacterized protein LOC18429550 isoform X2 n=1 Tax=Amborella trichopoda TaxID=13333 RepID=UPI0009BFC86F|nr:uncharacterized protein LOC18429550 isoform X2 [Amborella trichopoda]|eukprot:XP_020520130.1 uncharacterized protein LOC18429550 isoform X2 [Amborella trichopoda]
MNPSLYLKRPTLHQGASKEREMSSIGTAKGLLEIAKFGLYVTIPIILMYNFAYDTKNLQRIMGNRSYVVYPPEGPRPPPPEEIREMARRNSLR